MAGGASSASDLRGATCAPTRGEGFISVIAGFALVGIALGVGTLIVVLPS